MSTQPITANRVYPRVISRDRIEAAKAGAEWAWEELYAELGGPVTGYLRTRGAPDPDDLASEVFFQVARGINGFDGDESEFRSWVFVIAHRRLIDARRSESRRPETIVEPADERDERHTQGGDVEDEVMENLALAQMKEVLSGLTDDQCHVLTLRLIGDLSLEETAVAMGKRVGAVKSLQRRALANLKTQLESGAVSL